MDAASAVDVRWELAGEQGNRHGQIALDYVHTMSIIDEMGTDTSADLRRTNLTRALRAVHLAGGRMSRAELARELSCSRATAAALVGDLSALGLLHELGAVATGRRGRPTPTVTPAVAAPAVVALEVGVERLRIATSTIGGTLEDLAEASLITGSAETVAALAAELLEARIATLGSRCVGVGIGVFGLVEQSNGLVLEAPNLGWRDIDLVSMLHLPSHLPVRVNNVANLVAVADSIRGVGRGCETVIYLHASIGVGGTLVRDGRPLLGRLGIAGEYGHLPLGGADLPCRCGLRGCWETEVDQFALARAAGVGTDARGAATTADEVFRAAAAGDPSAQAAVRVTAAAMGRGLAALVDVHDPDLIVLAGHAAHLHAWAGDIVEDAARSHVLTSHRERLAPIRPTPLGDGAGLLGAAEDLFSLVLSDPVTLARHASGRGDA